MEKNPHPFQMFPQTPAASPPNAPAPAKQLFPHRKSLLDLWMPFPLCSLCPRWSIPHASPSRASTHPKVFQRASSLGKIRETENSSGSWTLLLTRRAKLSSAFQHPAQCKCSPDQKHEPSGGLWNGCDVVYQDCVCGSAGLENISIGSIADGTGPAENLEPGYGRHCVRE